jgi:predicted DNA-binding transcriptional regulator AlpA
MPRMAFEARARMWEAGGRWYARILDAPAYIEVTGMSRHGCLAELRKVTGDDVTLTVEVIPAVVGVAEAAEIMGWDKRRVITYIDRGSFPEPITALASGRIWLREDVEAYAADWRARHPAPPARDSTLAPSAAPGGTTG